MFLFSLCNFLMIFIYANAYIMNCNIMHDFLDRISKRMKIKKATMVEQRQFFKKII